MRVRHRAAPLSRPGRAAWRRGRAAGLKGTDGGGQVREQGRGPRARRPGGDWHRPCGVVTAAVLAGAELKDEFGAAFPKALEVRKIVLPCFLGIRPAERAGAASGIRNAGNAALLYFAAAGIKGDASGPGRRWSRGAPSRRRGRVRTRTGTRRRRRRRAQEAGKGCGMQGIGIAGGGRILTSAPPAKQAVRALASSRPSGKRA
jgi:hypothetical protein